jgi:energy-coupling factor transport system ATP-binding protein
VIDSSLKDCGGAAFSSAFPPRASPAAPIVRLEHFSFTYEGAARASLADLDLEVWPGEFVGVVGAEGSGRTTLFRVLNGSAPRHFPGTWSGSVGVGGFDACSVGHAALGSFVASIFDDPDAQIVSLTVEEEVCFALVQRGFSSDTVAARMREALAATGLSGLERRATSSLSGGQKQRLVTASALALEPSLVLLDESTGALDPRGAQELYALLGAKCGEKGLTVVAVERDLELLMDYADRVVAMESGRIVMDAGHRGVASHSRLLKRIGVRLPAWLDAVDALAASGHLAAPLPETEAEAVARIAELLKAGRMRGSAVPPAQEESLAERELPA